MTLDRYAEWLARGRAHQTDGRLTDALLCYRRALHEVAAGVEARFHVGEIAWQFGNSADAIAAWESAIALTPWTTLRLRERSHPTRSGRRVCWRPSEQPFSPTTGVHSIRKRSRISS